MQITVHKENDVWIAEIISDHLIISNSDDGTDLLGNLYFRGFNKVILHEKNITPDFFELRTKLAGEILQKFSNYRVKLAIVGHFENRESKSLDDFVFESNKFGQVNFVRSTEEAIERLSQ